MDSAATARTPTPRRRYGRGSLRREGKHWVLRIRLEAPEAGQQRLQRSIRLGLVTELRTRGAARSVADHQLHLLGIAHNLQGKRAKVTDYVNAHMIARVAILKRNSRAVLGTYSRHLVREFADRYLDELTPGRVQLAIANLSRAGLAPPTIRSIVSFLRRILHAARAEGLAVINLGPRDIVLPKQSNVRPSPRCFSVTEIVRILEAAEWPWRALYGVLAHLGLRVGEGLGLQWDDLAFDTRLVHVRRQASRGELITTKSMGSSTALPVPESLAQILREYQAVWTADPRWSNPRGLLFANACGGPLWQQGVQRAHLTPLLQRLGIAHGGFHSFRHGLATRLFQQGAGAAAVQRLMRHSSIHTTMRYAAVSFDDLVRSSNAGAQPLAAALASAPSCAATVSPEVGKTEIPNASALPIGIDEPDRAERADSEQPP